MDMRNDSFFLKSVFAVAVTTLQFLFGGWSMPLQILVAVVIIDYLTGIGAAFVSKRLDSRVGARGIIRKIALFALVSLAHLLDTGMAMSAPVLQTATIWFFISNEGISITENLHEIGVPLPKALVEALSKLKD